MASKKRTSSTGNDPFGSYREFMTNISIDESIVDGLDLPSEPLNPFMVNWRGLLAGSEMNYPAVADMYSTQVSFTQHSAIGALVSITASTACIMRDRDAAPLPKEIERQLRDLHAALRRVGALAQGKKAEEQIAETPRWHTEAKLGIKGQQDDTPFPLQARSRILHPILQDHIELALGHGRDEIENDFERSQFDAHLVKQQRQLLEFFDELPEVMGWIQKSIKWTEAALPILKRERKKGAPSNRAADWAMIRLMWIWRDVLGREINIYVRRISGPVELDEPVPNACVSFVQGVMERIDPDMLPSNAQNLEHKLIELRRSVPPTPLIFDPSRDN